MMYDIVHLGFSCFCLDSQLRLCRSGDHLGRAEPHRTRLGGVSWMGFLGCWKVAKGNLRFLRATYLSCEDIFVQRILL